MKFSPISVNGNGHYLISLGGEEIVFPRVSTILEKTRSHEEIRRINHWRKESALKLMRSFRKCENCEFHDSTLSICTAGEKLRKNLQSKNRCQSFSPTPTIIAKMEEVKERPRERGTGVHKIIENYFAYGEMPTRELCKFSSHIAPLLAVLEPRFIEEPVISQINKYAGRLDFLGDYRGELTLIDWTTSKAIKPVQYYEHKFLQLGAYAIAAEEHLKVCIERMAVVVMSSDNAKWIDVEFGYRDLFLKRVRDYYR